MKTLGLIGGISPQSTLIYYQYINKRVNEIMGAHHSAKIVMVSVDFEEVVAAIFANDWVTVKNIMLQASLTLDSSNVDCIAFCSNTLYKVFAEVSLQIKTPIFHILDPVIDIIKKNNFSKVALLGTDFTMSLDFHKNYISKSSNVDLIIPDTDDKSTINNIIFKELCYGKIEDTSKRKTIDVVSKLQSLGADAIILGCTELPLLFKELDLKIPLINTTLLHAEQLSQFACNTIHHDTVSSNILTHIME